MASISRAESTRNDDETIEAAWPDLAVVKIAQRFALPISLAIVVAHLAGLGNREAA